MATRVPFARGDAPFPIVKMSEGGKWNVAENGPTTIQFGDKDDLLIAEQGSQRFDIEDGTFKVPDSNSCKRLKVSADRIQKARSTVLNDVPLFYGKGAVSNYQKTTAIGAVGPTLPNHIVADVVEAAIANNWKELSRILAKYVRSMKPFPPLHVVLPPMLPNGLKECIFNETTGELLIPWDTAITLNVLKQKLQKRTLLLKRGFVIVSATGDFKCQEYELREMIVQAYIAQIKPCFDRFQQLRPEEFAKQGVCSHDVGRIVEARENKRLETEQSQMATLRRLTACFRANKNANNEYRKNLARSFVVANIRLDRDLAERLVKKGATSSAHHRQRTNELLAAYKCWQKKGQALKDRKCMHATECPYADKHDCMRDMGLTQMPVNDPYELTPSIMMATSLRV